jgi:hypothetical protein
MTFRVWFDWVFGGTSILFGLLFLSAPVAFFLHLPVIVRGPTPPWFPLLMIGMAIVGAIQFGGGFGKIRTAGG